MSTPSLKVPLPYAPSHSNGAAAAVDNSGSQHLKRYLHIRAETWGQALEFKQSKFNDVFFLLFFVAQV